MPDVLLASGHCLGIEICRDDFDIRIILFDSLSIAQPAKPVRRTWLSQINNLDIIKPVEFIINLTASRELNGGLNAEYRL